MAALPARHTAPGKGIVTAVGPGYVVVKKTHIDYAACTIRQFPAGRSTPAVGDRIEWKGYVETNGNEMATRFSDD